MKEFSVNAKHIELEITESMVLNDTQHNIAVLGALHQLGFKIALDDFGTGFSSFSYLYRMPVDKVKIDRVFIHGLPDNQANFEIVKSMIAMLHSLKKTVVAEGAETDAEIEFLRQEGCDIVQGYYYYKPMSTDDFLSLITKLKGNM
jgi:EAL domain-containing protein (putative c-di-GMP-specific phosphodiesterase class I)